MNSPPSSRYSAAKAPITPTSERALEIGCVCKTRLMPHTTAIAAKIMKRSASIFRSEPHILGQGHPQAYDKKIDQGHREHECPGEVHQLVVAETRQRRSHPDVEEENESQFRRKPKQGEENGGHNRDQKYRRGSQENDAEHRQREAVERSGRIHRVREADQTDERKNDGRNESRAVLRRKKGLPSAQEQQRRNSRHRDQIAILRHEERREFHAGVFGVEAGYQLIFSFREIERNAIGLRKRGHQKQKKADNQEREGSLKNTPAGNEAEVVAGLRVHQFAKAERIEQQQRSGDRHRHRQFVADHLRRAAQAAQQ